MKYIPYALLLAAAALFPYCVQRVFLHTPIEAEMGTAQKIFYFHVPLAWICMLFAVICGVAAGVQLRRRSDKAEALAVAAGEMTVLAGVGVLITGPIWGDATWGTPWTGDARQVSTALLWLVFVAYLLVREYGPPNSERIAAALAIFGAIDVPIIYYAVKIWKTTHPQTGVVGSLPQSMWNTLFVCLAALMMLSIALVWIRAAQARMAIALDQAWIAADTQPGAAQPA
ncbi:Cytochrome c-type biogenesis protein CcmC, putative heme lyase for CcmE [Enhygromyxa salina]|uniref:Heme exporter protein C n=1 Tax=Enhygromyxa salina TaxID=215803 RepID=A0A0C1ZVE8_9BACT|nr:cytochrome c biogenesis protein CcsA [Enhygromyxa salina]KIG15038.1 Cytochrome c-type biogenesis protein CcmC, putative heme lyase for CcmE [Enhygromyxa salina]